MLHQRTTRRQGGGGSESSDPYDPTTTVYSSTPSMPSSASSTTHSTGGYGSAYGGPYGGYSSSNSMPTYGSNSSSNNHLNGGLYNDKLKKKKGGAKSFLQKVQDPMFIVSAIAVICFLFAVRYKLAHQHVVARHAKYGGESTLQQLQREKENLLKELKTVRESYKRQTMETKKLQIDYAKVKKQGGTDNTEVSEVDKKNLETISKLEKREKAWKKQYELLKDAVIIESRRSIIDKYGDGPYYVEFVLAIPTVKDSDGEYDEVVKSFIIEMAPIDLMPHTVHLFLEQVAHQLWDNGWFYLNGPHVFQAGPQVPDDEEYEAALEKGVDERTLALKPFKDENLDSVAFPEYSDKFPHLPWTLGLTGRPGGPDFYINKVDNSKTHGPGGQTHHDLTEHADPCFAKIVDGMDTIALMTNAPTVRDTDSNYRFFFEEPIQIVKVRIVKHPAKLLDLSNKLAGRQQEVNAANGETVGGGGAILEGIKASTASNLAEDVLKQQEERRQQEYYDQKHHDFVTESPTESATATSDENRKVDNEHHISRHRKHHKISDIRPEHTVEA